MVAINRFPTDTKEEIELIERRCEECGVKAVVADVWGQGGDGGIDLANEVLKLTEEDGSFDYLYDANQPIVKKIETIAREVYGADGVELTPAVKKDIARLEANGFGNLPVCMAKTQYSLSDDPKKLGWPKDFKIGVRGVKVSAGAGFIVALTGNIMTMPGLSKVPAAQSIDVDDRGRISGLF